jgi:hypothetical protein
MTPLEYEYRDKPIHLALVRCFPDWPGYVYQTAVEDTEYSVRYAKAKLRLSKQLVLFDFIRDTQEEMIEDAIAFFPRNQ